MSDVRSDCDTNNITATYLWQTLLISWLPSPTTSEIENFNLQSSGNDVLHRPVKFLFENIDCLSFLFEVDWAEVGSGTSHKMLNYGELINFRWAVNLRTNRYRFIACLGWETLKHRLRDWLHSYIIAKSKYCWSSLICFCNYCWWPGWVSGWWSCCPGWWWWWCWWWSTGGDWPRVISTTGPG